MNREQALDILCAFQEWRRYDGPIGEGPIMPCPKEIGQALDIAIGIMQGKEQTENPFCSFEQLKTMMGFPFGWTELPFLSTSGEPNPSKPTETP